MADIIPLTESNFAPIQFHKMSPSNFIFTIIFLSTIVIDVNIIGTDGQENGSDEGNLNGTNTPEKLDADADNLGKKNWYLSTLGPLFCWDGKKVKGPCSGSSGLGLRSLGVTSGMISDPWLTLPDPDPNPADNPKGGPSFFQVDTKKRTQSISIEKLNGNRN
jgi:hypothetical protein